jgi:1-acyl-sn-glycerol-3-phosphate acyltransferase
MIIFYQIKAVVVAFALLIFILLPGVVISIPFSLRNRLRIIGPVWSFCSEMLLKHACKAQIGMQEDLRSDAFKIVPAYGLFISNHQSFLDIPLLSTLYQIPPIMKQEILYIPIFGWIAWISGAMPLSRASNQSRKKVFTQAKRRILGDKLAVQVYPEGTRSKNAHPKEFGEIKKTLLIFAYREKIPVIPTSVYGTRNVLSDLGIVRVNKNVGIIVHKEIFPEHFSSADEFCRACWEKVREGFFLMENKLSPLCEN